MATAVAVAALSACAPVPDAAAPAWAPCPNAAGLQCATIPVPLDHDDPAAGSIGLAVAKLPASAPAPDAAPIVLHRGGPGYGTVDYLELVVSGQLPAPVDDSVRREHDLIAVDQRGTGRSGPVLPCRDAPVSSAPPVPRAGQAPFPDVPFDAGGLAGRVDRDRDLRARCLSAPELRHVGTVDAARDLDLVRAALGQERLTMVGQSYGGYLATVYAALYPGRVGRLVLDSTVDATTRARGAPESTMAGRTGSDVASEKVLDDFLARCAQAGAACPFGAGDPAGAFAELLGRLRAAPKELRTADGTPVRLTSAHVLQQVGQLLYQPSTWKDVLAPYLAYVAQAIADPSAPIAAGVAEGVRLADRQPLESVTVGFEAVTCREVAGPAGPRAWAASVQRRREAAPRFAAMRAADTLPCVGVQRDATPLPAFDGPIRTDGQVLLVHDRLDPAAPLAGAQATARLFGRSALVVNDGPGHIAAQQSRCTVAAASAFLRGGPLPAASGTTCTPDRDPFTS